MKGVEIMRSECVDTHSAARLYTDLAQTIDTLTYSYNYVGIESTLVLLLTKYG